MIEQKLKYKIIPLGQYGPNKEQTGISVENFVFTEDNIKKFLENTKKDETKS